MRLTNKQEMFCREYLIDLNAKQAAIRAGYSHKTAEVQGSRLLSNAKVSSFIQELKAEREQRLEIDSDKVLQEVYDVAMARVTDIASVVKAKRVIGLNSDGEVVEAEQEYVSFKESEDWPENAKAAVASLGMNKEGIVMKMHDKGAHLEKLMKHLGLYAEDNNQNRPNEIKITIDGSGVAPVTSEDDINEDI
jgi:phage terminase small subunit